MAERIPKSAGGTQYFKSEYSGLRFPVIPYFNTGLEDPVAAANIDTALLISNDQPSEHEIQIRGNPDLMSDLHRKPSEAAELENAGNAKLYKIPESYPMYLKIDIFLKPDSRLGLGPSPAGINQKYFYQNHYEITAIINDMSDGGFYQIITLEKTDNIV